MTADIIDIRRRRRPRPLPATWADRVPVFEHGKMQRWAEIVLASGPQTTRRLAQAYYRTEAPTLSQMACMRRALRRHWYIVGCIVPGNGQRKLWASNTLQPIEWRP